MKSLKCNVYNLEITPHKYKCLSVNGDQIDHFIHPDTQNNMPKLYVVKNGNTVCYVGITSQSMSTRLRIGFKADGKTGYWGYKWKNELTNAELYIWSFPSKDKEYIEAIEGELVYYLREQTGKWPKHQMEIHFHPDVTKEQSDIAKTLLKATL